MRVLDEAGIQRAARQVALALPRVPHRGRVGESRAASLGSSLEVHDFRTYQPGDDLRQLDWNAVARTGELVLRVRQEEVAPRVEVVLDGSRSMAVSPEKAARACEVALLLCQLAQQGGQQPVLLITSQAPLRCHSGECAKAVRAAAFDGVDDLGAALRRCPALRPCGLRLVVSDFLFEAPLERFAESLARGASGLALVQLLDEEDAQPSGGVGARLVDAENGEVLERMLAPSIVEDYRRRLAEHQQLLRAAARRVRAMLVSAVAGQGIEEVARGPLRPLWESGA